MAKKKEEKTLILEGVDVDIKPIDSIDQIDTVLENYKTQPLEVVELPGNGEDIEDSQGVEVGMKKPEIGLKETKKRGRPRKEKPVVISGEIISGALFIMLIDLAIPQVIAIANNQFSKNKIDANELRLTKAQKDELQPLADQVVKQLEITGNPVYIFILSMMGIYGLNFAMLKQTENIGKK